MQSLLYPSEEYGYRRQDKISLNNHIEEKHDSVGVSLMNILEEFGIERLPEVSKGRKKNFDGLIIDNEGNIKI